MKTKTTILFLSLLLTNTLYAQILMNIHKNDGTTLHFPLVIVDSITYTNHLEYNTLVISTLPAGNIASTSAILYANILSDGGATVISRGFCWDTNPNPTTSNNTSYNNSGTGGYSRKLFTLSPNTTYYVRAFANNGNGHIYGNEISFTTTESGGLYTEGNGVLFDGYQYPSIVYTYGKEWMSENLRTSIYSNGELIPNITNDGQWVTLTTGAWASYNNISQYENTYGKLYNWHAVSDSRSVCPSGWHVPSNQEWTDLVNFLGGQNIAGGKLKNFEPQYWTQPNIGATNESGFNAYPSGSRGSSIGVFSDSGNRAVWWSSNPYGSDAWGITVYYNSISSSNFHVDKKAGFAIRCIKD